MTLRIGPYELGSSFLLKLAFVCFLIGIHIGTYLAARSEGKRFPHIAFLAIYLVIIPMIIRRMKGDIKRIR